VGGKVKKSKRVATKNKKKILHNWMKIKTMYTIGKILRWIP
jgi:hypothetical protein